MPYLLIRVAVRDVAARHAGVPAHEHRWARAAAVRAAPGRVRPGAAPVAPGRAVHAHRDRPALVDARLGRAAPDQFRDGGARVDGADRRRRAGARAEVERTGDAAAVARPGARRRRRRAARRAGRGHVQPACGCSRSAWSSSVTPWVRSSRPGTCPTRLRCRSSPRACSSHRPATCPTPRCTPPHGLTGTADRLAAHAGRRVHGRGLRDLLRADHRHRAGPRDRHHLGEPGGRCATGCRVPRRGVHRRHGRGVPDDPVGSVLAARRARRRRRPISRSGPSRSAVSNTAATRPVSVRRVQPEHVDAVERLSDGLGHEVADPVRVAGDLEALNVTVDPAAEGCCSPIGQPLDEVRQLRVLGHIVEADLAPAQVEPVRTPTVAVRGAAAQPMLDRARCP